MTFILTVDHERWEWTAPTITGDEMRDLVGIPNSAQVFHKVQGEPDHEVHDATVIDISDGKQRFSTQSKSSYAGCPKRPVEVKETR